MFDVVLFAGAGDAAEARTVNASVASAADGRIVRWTRSRWRGLASRDVGTNLRRHKFDSTRGKLLAPVTKGRHRIDHPIVAHVTHHDEKENKRSFEHVALPGCLMYTIDSN